MMNQNNFELVSKFKPTGDQPKAIKELVEGINEGKKFQVLLGATGTGKTYAYLIPALLARKKVVISTGTKALQDQLIKYDVPKLLSLLKLKTPYKKSTVCLQKISRKCIK